MPIGPEEPLVRSRRASHLAAALAVAAIGLLVPRASAALPVPVNCQNDVDGANDRPGQTDVTRFCVDVGDGMPFEFFTLSNWDETTLSGNNTADVCRLFDSDGDGLVNFASCVTLKSSGTANGNLAVLSALRLFSCTDASPDRCTGSVLIPGPYGTTCEVSRQSTDPFGPSAPNGPGSQYPYDTQILCGLDLDDFGVPGVKLVDACAYPSAVPNSAPSDCVLFKVCTSGAQCDDTNPCTADSCDTTVGACVHVPTPGEACADAWYCNGEEVCNELGFCENVGPRDCDDGVSCTIDGCDELADTCVHDPRNSLCSDGLFCTGVETCDPVDDCRPGTQPLCDDGVACTIDACDAASDACVHTSSDAACSDGEFCTGVETCDPLNDCMPGTPPACDDGVGCTLDTCDEAGDACAHAATDAACDDGLYCDGAETCDAQNGCTDGAPPNCDDGVPCTADACNETFDTCDNVPENAACNDGEFCTGVEVCDPTSGCVPGLDPCPGAACDEILDLCTGCAVDADCDDGVFCNGVEACATTGVCVAGMPLDCDDGVNCTHDVCDEAFDACLHSTSDSACSDGQFCTGIETCDPVDDCTTGAPPDCDDAVSCTVDACDESFDACMHSPDDAACDDGVFCNGAETCHSATDCSDGTPVACGDAFACSTDTCDEDTDACVYDFSTCVCGDAEITGQEDCEPPETAGTFEDCNNVVDDDGDGAVDCRDTDCAPAARDPLCDEECTLDNVCRRLIKDPALIAYRWDGSPDSLKLHGRFALRGELDPLTDGVVFQFSNRFGSIYRVALGVGDLIGRPGGKRFKFVDKTARQLGTASPGGGLYRLGLILRTDGGVPYLAFKVRAYGDFSPAVEPNMTAQISVGTEVGALTAEWIAKPGRWKLTSYSTSSE